MSVKQCLVLPIFYREDWGTFDAFCARIAAIGYSAIEVMAGVQNLEGIVATAGKNGLAVASMVGHASLPDGLNKAGNHDRIEAELRASIDQAADLGIPSMICFSGNRNPGQSDYEGMVTCAHGLRRVVPYAEKKGITLNMELLNSKVDHPGYQCDHTDWGIALCEMVNSPSFKLLFDIYHMQIMEGDIIRTLRKNIQWIGHFHTAGNPGRNDMDDTQELNYTGICRAIDSTDYAGYVGHEFTPLGDRMAALEAAYNICAD